MSEITPPRSSPSQRSSFPKGQDKMGKKGDPEHMKQTAHNVEHAANRLFKK